MAGSWRGRAAGDRSRPTILMSAGLTGLYAYTVAITTIALTTIVHAFKLRAWPLVRRPRQEGRHGIRLLHAQRQPLRQQSAHAEPVRRRHHRRGALCRHARHELGLDRRASFQFARRALLPRPRARLYRGAHQAHPAGAGRHRAAAAPSDPRRRAMGDARSALQRPRRFRRRPRLRQARIRSVPRLVRRQPGHLRGRPRAGAPAVVGRWPHLAPRPALFVRRRAHHAEAGAAADPDLCRIVLEALDRARRPARLRPDRRAVRRRDELRRPASRSPTSTTRPASSTATSPAG